jgi:large-conductance mechanosensitive channel
MKGDVLGQQRQLLRCFGKIVGSAVDDVIMPIVGYLLVD